MVCDNYNKIKIIDDANLHRFIRIFAPMNSPIKFITLHSLNSLLFFSNGLIYFTIRNLSLLPETILKKDCLDFKGTLFDNDNYPVFITNLNKEKILVMNRKELNDKTDQIRIRIFNVNFNLQTLNLIKDLNRSTAKNSEFYMEGKDKIHFLESTLDLKDLN